MLSLVFVTDSLAAGGIEGQVAQLAQRLDPALFSIHVLCLYGARANRSPHYTGALETASISVEILDLGLSAWGKLQGWFKIIGAMWRIRPDLVHAFNYHSNLLCRLARPFMPSSVSLIGDVEANYTAKQLFYERLSGWLCSAITCNSPVIARDLTEQAHLPLKKIVEIPNGIDLSRFADSRNSQNTAAIRQGAAWVLAMVARVSKEKSPHLLAHAIGLLKQRGQLPHGVRVIIAGPSEDRSMQALLDQTVQTYALSTVIEQPGAVHHPELLYAASDFTVLFSLTEGLPYAVIESLAAGRPVVISEAANRAGLIDDGVTGWIVPTEDVEELAHTLSQIFSMSRADLRACYPACVRRAQDFSIENMVARYANLYLHSGTG